MQTRLSGYAPINPWRLNILHYQVVDFVEVCTQFEFVRNIDCSKWNQKSRSPKSQPDLDIKAEEAIVYKPISRRPRNFFRLQRRRIRRATFCSEGYLSPEFFSDECSKLFQLHADCNSHAPLVSKGFSIEIDSTIRLAPFTMFTFHVSVHIVRICNISYRCTHTAG